VYDGAPSGIRTAQVLLPRDRAVRFPGAALAAVFVPSSFICCINGMRECCAPAPVAAAKIGARLCSKRSQGATQNPE
jgi:hypothetical protein